MRDCAFQTKELTTSGQQVLPGELKLPDGQQALPGEGSGFLTVSWPHHTTFSPHRLWKTDPSKATSWLNTDTWQRPPRRCRQVTNGPLGRYGLALLWVSEGWGTLLCQEDIVM